MKSAPAILSGSHTNGNGAPRAARSLRVSIFGMGYVGTVSAGCLARMGHHVIGLDANPTKVELLGAGRSPVIEPGLAELIAAEAANGHLCVSLDAAQAVRDTDVTLYCVGTPGHANGGLNLDAVRDVCRSIGEALRKKPGFHVVVTRSTMLPGTTRTVVIPSTMAWVFASLSPAISFALIGVIVGEFIGAERGIGRLIIESEARAEASGMMVAVIVLMLVGVALSAMIWRLQAHLLRWQQHNMVE